MAQKICPSCGAAFNGRKCKNCLYVPFTEEIAHGLHTHEGEPLILEEPVKKPRSKSVRCDRRTRRPPKWLKTIIGWILILNLLPLGIEWIQSGIDRATREPEPAPVLSPQAFKLWEGEDITVWTDKASNPTQIPILVENNSGDDISVSSEQIFLGEFQTTYTHLYVSAYEGSWGRGYLYLDEEDLNFAGVGPFEEVRFDLEIYDSDSYDTLYETEGIVIPLAQSIYGVPAPEGLSLIDEQDISLRYLGYRGSDGQLVFQFLVENRGEEKVSVWTQDAGFDGKEADISLWEEIFPGCTAVARAYAYPESPIAPKTLNLTLRITDETYEQVSIAKPVEIPLQ